MQAVRATISVGDEGVTTFAALLRQFPAGSQVKLEMTSASATSSSRDVNDYRQKVAQARRQFVKSCPWTSTEEALRDLRAGELE